MSAFGGAGVERKPSFDGPRSPIVWAKDSLPLLVLVGVAVTLFLVLRGGGEDRRSFTFSPTVKPLPLGAASVRGLGSLGASTFEGAAPAVAREAERIAGSNPTLARLRRLGDGRRLGNAGVWSVGNRTRGGAILGFRLRRPVAVDSDLPYVEIPPDGPSHGTCTSPYAPGWAHLRATGVTELMVFVDLGQGRVAATLTNARSGTVSPVAGKPYPTCDEDQTG